MAERLTGEPPPPDEDLPSNEFGENAPSSDTLNRFRDDTEQALHPFKRAMVRYVHGTVPGTQGRQVEDGDTTILVRHEFPAGRSERITDVTIINGNTTPNAANDAYIGDTISLRDDGQGGITWLYDSPVYTRTSGGKFIRSEGRVLPPADEQNRVLSITERNTQGVTDHAVRERLQRLHQVASASQK